MWILSLCSHNFNWFKSFLKHSCYQECSENNLRFKDGYRTFISQCSFQNNNIQHEWFAFYKKFLLSSFKILSNYGGLLSMWNKCKTQGSFGTIIQISLRISVSLSVSIEGYVLKRMPYYGLHFKHAQNKLVMLPTLWWEHCWSIEAQRASNNAREATLAPHRGCSVDSVIIRGTCTETIMGLRCLCIFTMLIKSLNEPSAQIAQCTLWNHLQNLSSNRIYMHVSCIAMSWLLWVHCHISIFRKNINFFLLSHSLLGNAELMKWKHRIVWQGLILHVTHFDISCRSPLSKHQPCLHTI